MAEDHNGRRPIDGISDAAAMDGQALESDPQLGREPMCEPVFAAPSRENDLVPVSRDAYPSLIQAAGLVVLAAFLIVLFQIPIWILMRSHTPMRMVATGVCEGVAMSLVIGLGFRKTGSSFSEVLPVKTVRSSLVIPMGIMLIGGILAAAAVNVVVQIAIPKPSSVRGAVGSFLDAGFWSALFTVVILGPLTEEFLFRGVILRGLLRNYGRRRAILLSALLFSLFHVNPWQVSISFVLGALFAWWVVETGSLLPGILGHQVNNLSLLLLGMAGKNAMRHDQPTTVRLLLTGLALLLLGTALLGAGTWLFKRTGRLTKPPR